METWLLGAGAIVLIAITLWLVWPTHTAEALETLDSAKEDPAMTPQGDRFQDQYTSATADLSAGGVAAALDSMNDETFPTPPATTPGPPPATAAPPPATPDVQFRPASAAGSTAEPWSSPTVPRDNTGAGYPYQETDQASFARPKTLGISAGAFLTLCGAVGGAWFYARWRRERNKPINRLRRGARDVASRLGERLPDVDELPLGPAPMSGAATALLLTSFLASRALRQRDSADDRSARMADVVERGRKQSSQIAEVVERGRKQARRIPMDRLATIEPRRPAVMGFGFGTLAVVAGGAFLIWRLLRGDRARQQNWYAGE